MFVESMDKQAVEIDSLLIQPVLCCHPFVVGELVVGDFGKRRKVISVLQNVNNISTVRDEDVVEFIREKKLFGRGIGYIDCHLLASVFKEGNTFIWKSDKRFRRATIELGLAFLPESDYDKFIK